MRGRVISAGRSTSANFRARDFPFAPGGSHGFLPHTVIAFPKVRYNPPAMDRMDFTTDQRRAIEFTGREILVSASAGSGKTAVLAERCAFLVCDAPPPYRCDIEELLVLTFTEAAAAEMRGRIVEAIRKRSAARPDDLHLRDQLALVDSAQISTVHSFCLWLVRRWFAAVGVDPDAAVLSAEEAALLRHETKEDLFASLYREGRATDDSASWLPVESVPSPMTHHAGALVAPITHFEAALGSRFLELVDDYGLGEDREISSLLLRLHEFTCSLPDPDAWLTSAYHRLSNRPEEVVKDLLAALNDELNAQVEACEELLARWERSSGPTGLGAEAISEYLGALREWKHELDRGPERTPSPGRAEYDAFDHVLRQIAAYEWMTRRRSSGKSAARDDVAEEGAAKALKHVKDSLWAGRLRDRFAQFSVAEWSAGANFTAPYVGTLVDLVVAFREAYARRKRTLRVLDFSDLERFAHDLLKPDQNSGRARSSAVSSKLQSRFRHVLVDEFQDINPIQEAIVRGACRFDVDGRCLNLFAVGDVKQSIYRFRLAEPRVFLTRLALLDRIPDFGETVFLQSNFRSRPEILESVNSVFRPLMRPDIGGMAYDRRAELSPGREFEVGRPVPVELHMVERNIRERALNEDEEESDEPDPSALGDPSRWTAMEREAFLIGTTIKGWKSEDSFSVAGRPMQFRDAVILLRSTKVNADRTATILRAMGIPVTTETGGELLAAREVRDVLAVLHVLDNPEQDIPLAALLRGGILGGPFREDDLITIRCFDRGVPFHRAVRLFAERGEPGELRERLRTVWRRVSRYRELVRCRPLAEVLWDLYDRRGVLAYASGLPRGSQRAANLIRLHELARKFGTFRRRTLFRFLRFVESVEETALHLSAGSSSSSADDAVRVMTIHQSKGLEFPIVFLAGLGTSFNLSDRSGRMIFGRDGGIGLRGVDRKRMIEYPSAAHTLVALEIERTTREEELRVLYVAMTRARERLVLIGSCPGSKAAADRCFEKRHSIRPARLAVATALNPLDWLGEAIGFANPESAEYEFDRFLRGSFRVFAHDSDGVLAWRVARTGVDAGDETLRAVARRLPLPPTEPRAPNDPEIALIRARLDHVYPSLSATAVRSVVSAGEFKGTYDFMQDAEEQGLKSPIQNEFEIPRSSNGRRRDRAALRGTTTHRVFQHLPFERVHTPADVQTFLDRMESEGLVVPDERAAVDTDAVVWFLGTPLAEAIRRAGSTYRREFPFVSAEPAEFFDRTLPELADDFVLVRGIVDGILPAGEGIELIDFKTDAIGPEWLAERIEKYRPQMTVYARAVGRMWQRKVTKAWLIFLSARTVVALDDFE